MRTRTRRTSSKRSKIFLGRAWPALDIHIPRCDPQLQDLVLAELDDFQPTAIQEPEDLPVLRAFFTTPDSRDAAARALGSVVRQPSLRRIAEHRGRRLGRPIAGPASRHNYWPDSGCAHPGTNRTAGQTPVRRHHHPAVDGVWDRTSCDDEVDVEVAAGSAYRRKNGARHRVRLGRAGAWQPRSSGPFRQSALISIPTRSPTRPKTSS